MCLSREIVNSVRDRSTLREICVSQIKRGPLRFRYVDADGYEWEMADFVLSTKALVATEYRSFPDRSMRGQPLVQRFTLVWHASLHHTITCSLVSLLAFRGSTGREFLRLSLRFLLLMPPRGEESLEVEVRPKGIVSH